MNLAAKRSALRLCTLIVCSLLQTCDLLAQQGQPAAAGKPQAASSSEDSDKSSTEALQKATQNPVASLISVPLQNNTNFGIGPYDRAQNILNIQPVIPVGISKDWNLIVRWIAPIISQPAPGTANLEVYGIEEGTPLFSRLRMFRRMQASTALETCSPPSSFLQRSRTSSSGV